MEVLKSALIDVEDAFPSAYLSSSDNTVHQKKTARDTHTATSYLGIAFVHRDGEAVVHLALYLTALITHTRTQASAKVRDTEGERVKEEI